MAQRRTKKAQAAEPPTDLPSPPEGLTKEETRSVEKRRRLRAVVVYEIIRVEGEGELARTKAALWWSALGAGLSIGFSLLAQALLKTYLPASPGAWIVEALGYSVGFLIVILSRQQLFTENTLTAVLPVIARRKLEWVWVMLRLWGIVLGGNLVGCFLFASFLAFSGTLSPEIASAAHEVGAKLMTNAASEMFVKGIVAGWLIAALVWMLPSAEGTEIFVITLMTYLIALGGFAHVVAGSAEALYLLLTGAESLGRVVFVFFLPTLAGNVFGGTLLFAVLSYAQVREEID
jgi:formate/nitrite transporter FocA (FNT family)